MLLSACNKNKTKNVAIISSIMPDKYLFYLMLTGRQVTCVILSMVVTNQNACQLVRV